MADYSVGPDATLTLGVFNGEGQNVTTNADSALLIVGRAAVRPISYISVGGNLARFGSDSTRYGADVTISYLGALLRGEYLGQDRDGVDVDDKGWYALATYRVVPWVQLVFKQEEFKRPAISAEVRNQASTVGVNVEFNAAKVRLAVDYVTRKIGTPGVRRGSLLTQAQVKF